MQVTGTAVFANGQVTLNLAPVPVAVLAPPSMDYIMNLIHNGTLPVHPTRADVTRSDVCVAMCKIQRANGLVTGQAGQWNADCWERFEAWLMAAKRGRVMALPPPPPPASL
jgi:hypothetical protein